MLILLFHLAVTCFAFLAYWNGSFRVLVVLELQTETGFVSPDKPMIAKNRILIVESHYLKCFVDGHRKGVKWPITQRKSDVICLVVNSCKWTASEDQHTERQIPSILSQLTTKDSLLVAWTWIWNWKVIHGNKNVLFEKWKIQLGRKCLHWADVSVIKDV